MVGIAGIHTFIGGIRTIIIPMPIGIIPTIATLGLIKETVTGNGLGPLRAALAHAEHLALACVVGGRGSGDFAKNRA